MSIRLGISITWIARPKSFFRVGTERPDETMRRSVVKRYSPHSPVAEAGTIHRCSGWRHGSGMHVCWTDAEKPRHDHLAAGVTSDYNDWIERAPRRADCNG